MNNNKWKKIYGDLSDTILTEEEVNKYIEEYKETKSEEASDKIIKSYLRYIIKIVESQVHYNSKIDPVALVNAGCIGVFKAIEKYEKREDNKFLAYAEFFIRREIIDVYKEEGYAIKITDNYNNLRLQYKKLKNKCKLENIELTDEEIIKEFDIKSEKGLNTIKGLGASNTYCVCSYETLGYEVGYILDKEKTTEKGKEFNYDMERTLIEADNIKLIKEILNEDILTEREKDIINLLFGLNGDNPLTMIKIGEKYNISKERVYQIKTQIFKKLKKELLKRGFEKSDLMLTA